MNLADNHTAAEVNLPPAERALYEKWSAKIGEVCVSQPLQEAMDDGLVIYFYCLRREACWTWIKQWAVVNQDYDPQSLDLISISVSPFPEGRSGDPATPANKASILCRFRQLHPGEALVYYSIHIHPPNNAYLPWD